MPRYLYSINTNELCSYGCGSVAKFSNRQGSLLCDTSSSKCSAVRMKNSERLKIAHKEGKIPSDFSGKRNWARGLTKNTDSRIMNSSMSKTGKRRITDKTKIEKSIYREQCNFNLSGIIHLIEGYDLLEKHGMYHRTKNPGGVVRDHIVSVHYGYTRSIDTKIISHPANCRFLSHKDNAIKARNIGMSLEELMNRIKQWDHDGNWHTLLNESQ